MLPLLDIGTLDDLSLDGGVGLLAFLRDATANAGDPLVEAHARYALAALLDRRGLANEAQRVRAPLALIDAEVALAGPFAVERGAELPVDEALPAQAALLAGALASPRRLTAASHGVLPVGAWVRPAEHVAAYVIIALRSTRARDVAVRVGSTGALAVFVNGRSIGGRTGERALSLDADGYGAALRKGTNRLVVRVATSDHRPELLLRITGLRGEAITDVTVESSYDALPVDRDTRPISVRTLRSALVGADRDEYVVLSGTDGERPGPVCAKLDRTASLEVLLRCSADVDAKRRVLEASNLTSARLQLAEQTLRSRTPRRGEDLLVELARGEARVTWRTRLRLAELDSERGLLSGAQATLEALYREAPARRILEVAAQLAQRRGLRDAALSLYKRQLDEMPGDAGVRRQLASLQKAGGTARDLRAALDTLAFVPDVRDLESFATERADLREGLDDLAGAEAELDALLVLAPNDARVEERLGRLLVAHERRADGLRHLEAALRLRPQNPELRGMMGELTSPVRADLVTRFAVDLEALRARAAKDDLGRLDPARVLYDSTTVRVHENGLEDAFAERVIEIGDRRGAEQESSQSIRYAPDSQTVEVRTARVYKRSGEIVDSATIDEQDLSEPWAGLYYDVRAQVVSFPGLEPGDVLHLGYTVSDHGRRNEMGDSYGGLYMLMEKQVRLESRYRLLAPRSRALHFNEPRVGGVALAPVVTDEGDERRYELVARRVPKLPREVGMPGDTESGGYVHVSTFASWADVARFYRGLVRSPLEPDAAVTRAARDAVRGKTKVEDKVAAIYDLVVRSTRYVGLEFGIHGYQPYAVGQVWARKFGDCKDKASLLVAMLKEVGVPATLVLLRTRHEGPIAPFPASFSPFNHAIAYVPALDRYLDGTAELSGSSELPGEDQGAAVLHIDDGVLRTSPVLGAEGSVAEATLLVQLAADGAAKVTEQRTVRGQSAESWRRTYQSVAQRKERYAKAWSDRVPGTVVDAVDFPGLSDREQPVRISATLRMPHLGRSDGAVNLAAPVLLREPWLLAAFGKLSVRTEALELPASFIDREVVRFVVDRGWHIVAPAPVTVATPFGRFTLRYTTTPDGLRVESELVLATRRIEANQYSAFRAFLADVDRAIGGQLRIEPGR